MLKISRFREPIERTFKNGVTVNTQSLNRKTHTFLYDKQDKLYLLREKAINEYMQGENKVIEITKKYFREIKNALIEKITVRKVYDKSGKLVDFKTDKIFY